jgi:hypothetical protein
MFSQQVINEYVSLDIILGLVFVVLAIGIFAYYGIDYLLFCRRLRKNYEKEQKEKSKNPLL